MVERRIKRYDQSYEFEIYGEETEIDLLIAESLGHSARIWIKWNGFYSKKQKYY